MAHYLDQSNLTYLWGKIKGYVSSVIGELDIPSPGSTTPTMNGTGNTGSSTSYARADHVHPSDTSKQDVISDLSDIRAGATAGASAIPASQKGTAGGVASLDSNGKVPSSQLPSYVDDVIEAYPRSGQTELSSTWLSTTSGGAALTPESGKIYVLMVATTNYRANMEFRWGGSVYVPLNDSGASAMTSAEMDTATNNWT